MAKKKSRDKELDKKILLAVGGLAIVAFLGFVLYTSNGFRSQLGSFLVGPGDGGIVTFSITDTLGSISNEVQEFSEGTHDFINSYFDTSMNVVQFPKDYGRKPSLTLTLATRTPNDKDMEQFEGKNYGRAIVGDLEGRVVENEGIDATEVHKEIKVTKKGVVPFRVYRNSDHIKAKDEVFVIDAAIEGQEVGSFTVNGTTVPPGGKWEATFYVVLINDDGIPAEADTEEFAQ